MKGELLIYVENLPLKVNNKIYLKKEKRKKEE